MPLDTDFIRFSREMKPTKQCKISQKNLWSGQGGAVAPPPPPLNTPLIIIYNYIIIGLHDIMYCALSLTVGVCAIETSSSAVAKRPRDASCFSVVSFNSTKRRVGL